MNSVTPSRPAERLQRRRQLRRQREPARRRRGRSAPPAAAGRSAARAPAGAPGQLLAPVGELALPAPRRVSQLPLPGGEVGVLDRQLGQRRRPPRGEGRVERRQLAQQDADRPAVGDDVVHRRAAATCSLAAEPQQRGRGAAGRAPGRRGAAPRSPASAPRLGSPRRRGQRPRGRPAAAATATGRARSPAPARPSTLAKVVRSASWRRTISAKRRRQGAATSSAPASAHRDRDVVERAARLELVEEPEPLLGERERQRPPVARRRRERRRPRRPPPRAAAPPRPLAASPATVGASKSARSGSSTPNASRTRDTTCVASSEWPPRSKKSSLAPDRGRPPGPPTRSPPATSSTGVRGSCELAALRPRHRRRRQRPRGRACRWPSPAAPRGSRTPTGTMYSGSPPRRPSRSSRGRRAPPSAAGTT